jgi:hypothetical protein
VIDFSLESKSPIRTSSGPKAFSSEILVYALLSCPEEEKRRQSNVMGMKGYVNKYFPERKGAV